MAVQLDAIRATAERVAASHNLELVEIEFSGGAKFRTLRIFIEKNATERAKLIALAAKGEAAALAADATDGEPSAEEAVVLELPKGVPVELLSGVTHEDCAAFATDFGTVLDVEDLIPGAEYTLEVSSPGLERKLNRAEDYVRFQGSLVKLRLERGIQLLAQRLQRGLPFVPDHVDLGVVVGDGARRDILHPLIYEAVADVAVGLAANSVPCA